MKNETKKDLQQSGMLMLVGMGIFILVFSLKFLGIAIGDMVWVGLYGLGILAGYTLILTADGDFEDKAIATGLMTVVVLLGGALVYLFVIKGITLF